MNQYYNPVRTIQGVGCVEEIGALLRSQVPEGAQILLLAWNESVFELPAFAALDDIYSVHKVCFNESNPTVEQLFDLFCQTRDCIPAFVIAVGGGSIMDVGKALCCLYGKEVADTDALRRIISNKEYGIPAARWIGVPTTAGTGSETTCLGSAGRSRPRSGHADWPCGLVRTGRYGTRRRELLGACDQLRIACAGIAGRAHHHGRDG